MPMKKSNILSDCSTLLPDVECITDVQTQNENGTRSEEGNIVGLWNYTVYQNETALKRYPPSEEYWRYIQKSFFKSH